MAMKRILFLLADLVLLNAQLCTEIPNPGLLKQIDAGNGLVVGLEPTGNAFMLNGEDWLYLAGGMKHVSAGISGIWMVDNDNFIYRLIGGNLEKVSESFQQIDAGGDLFVAGIKSNHQSVCLSSADFLTMKPSSLVTWSNMDRELKYLTCGLNGCWGVNSADAVYFRIGIEPHRCQGNRWDYIAGTFSMVKVGSDGNVYAVKKGGEVYHRVGITDSKPSGTKWMKVNSITARAKDLAYDLNVLWLITQDDKILRCQM
ncbi:fish-egg lectin-like [Sceloporus undulatus]|uniref:fish-egg lectin-like n=1 Tax=Sceloporus undulatus TaxID=8520 RepID=UPI001C4AF88E|nr:fish-egg lectin-like [Sceloporus undulatus]